MKIVRGSFFHCNSDIIKNSGSQKIAHLFFLEKTASFIIVSPFLICHCPSSSVIQKNEGRKEILGVRFRGPGRVFLYNPLPYKLLLFGGFEINSIFLQDIS